MVLVVHKGTQKSERLTQLRRTLEDFLTGSISVQPWGRSELDTDLAAAAAAAVPSRETSTQAVFNRVITAIKGSFQST